MRRLSMKDLMSQDNDCEMECADPQELKSQGTPTPEPDSEVSRQASFCSSGKASIGFILGDDLDDDDDFDELTESDEDVGSRETSEDEDMEDAENAMAAATLEHKDGTPPPSGEKPRKKRKARICKEPGCEKYVVDHGLCIRHGGGKRCNVEGCNCRAQNRGLCWKHGGYTICKVEGCTKRAKSRGICWSHGGGTRCKAEGCTKIAVSLGRCWAHGGGKRCRVEGCRKPASERTNNYCADHFQQAQDGTLDLAAQV